MARSMPPGRPAAPSIAIRAAGDAASDYYLTTGRLRGCTRDVLDAVRGTFEDGRPAGGWPPSSIEPRLISTCGGDFLEDKKYHRCAEQPQMAMDTGSIAIAVTVHAASSAWTSAYGG